MEHSLLISSSLTFLQLLLEYIYIKKFKILEHSRAIVFVSLSIFIKIVLNNYAPYTATTIEGKSTFIRYPFVVAVSLLL